MEPRLGVRGGGSRAGFGDQGGAGQSFKLSSEMGVRAELNCLLATRPGGSATWRRGARLSSRVRVYSTWLGLFMTVLRCVLVFFRTS